MLMFLNWYVTATDDLNSNDVRVSRLSKLYPELYSYIEEADGIVIPHDALKYGFQRVVIYSNNSDVVVYLLHYARAFLQLGAIEIWIQSWTCHRKHFITLHELLRSLGKRKSRVILKTRVLFVSDVTRKIKLALKFLLWSLNQKNTWNTSKKKESCFGDVFWLVEKYLIQLCRSGAKLGTFSDLRDNGIVIVTSH